MNKPEEQRPEESHGLLWGSWEKATGMTTEQINKEIDSILNDEQD